MRQELHEERRSRIELACISLIQEKGWNAVSMRELAKRVNMAVGTLYNYYPSKVDLLVALFRARLEEHLLSGISQPKDVPEWIEMAFQAYTSFTREEWRSFMAFLYTGDKENHVIVWRSQLGVKAQLDGILKDYCERNTIPLELLSSMIFSLFYQSFQAWVHQDIPWQGISQRLTDQCRFLLQRMETQS